MHDRNFEMEDDGEFAPSDEGCGVGHQPETKKDMKKQMRVLWCYVEVLYAKFLNVLRVKRDTSIIPHGHYCYVWDDERNEREPRGNGRYWVKPCPYYRNAGEKSACTFVGYIGWDPSLSDQCKICNENLPPFEEEPLDCFIGSDEE